MFRCIIQTYHQLEFKAQGSKLEGAGNPGFPYILQQLPQISAGSSKMYWFLTQHPNHFAAGD